MSEAPKMSRAERSAKNKAEKAALFAAREAAKEADRAERELVAARARADAQAKASQLIPYDQVPKTASELRGMARGLTTWAMQTLVEIAGDPLAQPAGRVAALNAIIDRGWGKAIQPVALAPGEALADVDDETLNAYLMHNTTKYIEGELADVRGRNAEQATNGGAAEGNSPPNAPKRARRGDSDLQRSGAGNNRKKAKGA
jgi:hypothetical protein